MVIFFWNIHFMSDIHFFLKYPVFMTVFEDRRVDSTIQIVKLRIK